MMEKSYSRRAKEGLTKIENSSHCCNLAQFLGMLLFGGRLNADNIRFVTENAEVAHCFVRLLQAEFCAAVPVRQENIQYCAELTERETVAEIIKKFSLRDEDTGLLQYRVNEQSIASPCCKKAFLRGVFLAGGTVIDPNKNYNLEFLTPYYRLSQSLFAFLNDCGFPCKVVTRQSKYVIYVKNSDVIGDILAFIGAAGAQMELLNVKIEKELRNDLNRTVNSETANLEKTISAAVTQIRAIEKIQRVCGLEQLDDDLKETALLRLRYRDMSLGELGRQFSPPLTKSGVNHRLRRLVKFAEEL